VAVLPLASLGPDADGGYLADGLTAELIARLSTVKGLRVIARGSILPFKDAARSREDIGRQLRVGAHLEGSVQKWGERVRLTAHLVDTASGEHLWGEVYDSGLQDLVTVQLEIVRRVADVLQARERGDQDAEPAHAATLAPDAYMAYLKGRYFLDKRDEESAWQARDHFREALDLDPTYALAWTGWSDTLEVLAWLSLMSPREAYVQSQAAAERALQLEPDLPEAHVSLARALFRHHFDFEAAARHMRRAIALNPSHAEARQQHAAYLRIRGRFDEALNEARLAADLDPLSPSNRLEVGVTLYMARRYDEALAEYNRLLDTRPDFTPVYFFIALVHVQRQQYELALTTLERARPTARWQDSETLRAYIFAVTGRTAEARARLDELERRGRTEQISPWHGAVIHLGLGEHTSALDLLDLAFEQQSWQIPLLPVEPIFDPLRSNPRFVALVERIRR
jgi:adenylate cyclase